MSDVARDHLRYEDAREQDQAQHDEPADHAVEHREEAAPVPPIEGRYPRLSHNEPLRSYCSSAATSRSIMTRFTVFCKVTDPDPLKIGESLSLAERWRRRSRHR